MMKKVSWDMQSALTKHTFKLEHCHNCKCVLDLFTGNHLIAKDGKYLTVCGLCKSQLEVDGWREIARAKSIGRD
jgi:hypothetical protein